jgi:GNAT superfamily N-acetyltransferase
MRDPIDLEKARQRILAELPAEATWFLHDGNDPLRYSFADARRDMPPAPEIVGEAEVDGLDSLRVFGGYLVQGGASPLLALDTKSGAVKAVDVELEDPVDTLNASLDQFIATFRYFDEYLRGGRSLPGDALAALTRIDPDAVVEGAHWRALIEHVHEQEGPSAGDGTEPACVRSAIEPEIDQIVRWWEDLARSTESREGQLFHLAPEAARLARPRFLELMTRPQALLITASLDGRLAGFAHAEVRERPPMLEPKSLLHIESVYVAREARRRGVGAALLAACREWGRGRGLSLWSASVFRWDEAALGLCARAGLWAKTAGLVGRI